MEAPLNTHNKDEFPPMHTTEHILNQTMVRMFGCPRSRNAHIERKKSKCDYLLSEAPTNKQLEEIERTVNEIINQKLPIDIRIVARENVPAEVDLSKLPTEAGETLRLVYIGEYDCCACVGSHVNNTEEILSIGHFKITSSDYENGVLRIRFKLL